MKYFGKTKVLVPWFDTDGMKQRSLIILEGTIDKRALLKGIHNFIKTNFHKTVSNTWILKNCPIINQYDGNLTMVSNTEAIGRQFSEEVNAWLTRLEEEADAIEAGTDSGNTIQDTTGTTESVPALQDKIDSTGLVS